MFASSSKLKSDWPTLYNFKDCACLHMFHFVIVDVLPVPRCSFGGLVEMCSCVFLIKGVDDLWEDSVCFQFSWSHHV